MGSAYRWNEEDLENKNQEFLSWLRENPRAIERDAAGLGYRDLIKEIYKGSINNAKKSIGLEPRKGNSLYENEWEEKRQKLIEYLKENPSAGSQEIKSVFQTVVNRFYNGSVSEAMVAAGLSGDIEQNRQEAFERSIEFINPFDPRLSDNEYDSPENIALDRVIIEEEIKNALKMSTENRITVLKLYACEEMTLDEMSEDFFSRTIGRERVRQIKEMCRRDMKTYLKKSMPNRYKMYLKESVEKMRQGQTGKEDVLLD